MTASLAVKLLVTPFLVVGASLVARRWGARAGGWLVGFPFTSGPAALILVLEHGRAFAATAALGTLLGVISQAAFALGYSYAGRRTGWVGGVLAGTVAFGVCTLALAPLRLPALAAAIVVAACLSLALAAAPAPAQRASARPAPRWDLPVRVVVATGFVAGLTAVAGLAGPRLTGLLSPFPLYAAILAAFAHMQEGQGSAQAVMRGLLVGLYGFGAFFLTLNLLLPSAEPWLAFGAAILAVTAVQAASLLLTRRFSAAPAGPPR